MRFYAYQDPETQNVVIVPVGNPDSVAVTTYESRVEALQAFEKRFGEPLIGRVVRTLMLRDLLRRKTPSSF